MHEYGIASEILEIVFREMASREYTKVNKIIVTAGEYNLLTQEAMQNAFNLAAKNTKAEGAVLFIEQVPGMEIELSSIEAE